MFEGIRGWLSEKLNPAQGSIASSEGESPPASIVDHQKAYEEIEVVTRSVELIINGCAEVPFIVEGGPAKKVQKLLNVRPNAFEDRASFYRKLVMDLIIEGNSFIYYDNSDPGGAFYHLPAKDTTIIPDKKTYIAGYEYSPGAMEDGSLFGVVQRPSKPGKKKERQVIFFPSKDVIHVKSDSSIDIYRGDSRLKRIERLADLYYHLIGFQRQFFKNNAVPGMVLTTDNVLSRKIKERMNEEWKVAYSSLSKGSRTPAILDGGLKIDKFSTVNFRELDFEQSVERLEKSIAEALGVPSILIKSGNNANISPNQIMFYSHTILPILELFASAIAHRFGPDVIITPDKGSVVALRPDKKKHADSVSALVNNGIMTPNEGRKELRLGKSDEPEMDKIRIPANIAGSAVNPSIGGRPSGSTDDSDDEE